MGLIKLNSPFEENKYFKENKIFMYHIFRYGLIFSIFSGVSRMYPLNDVDKSIGISFISIINIIVIRDEFIYM
jgi:hypothetical protein